MIIYHHRYAIQPPAFLEGARDLCARESGEGGMLFGIGPVFLLGGETSEGVEIGDGWWAWIRGAVDPFYLRRDIRGQPTSPVEDDNGREWAIPVVLNPDGSRAFNIRYGDGWKPAPTPAQASLLESGNEARSVLPRLLRGKPEEREDHYPVAFSIVASGIEYCNHISRDVLQKLQLLDEGLVVGGLTVMSSFQEKADA